MQDLSNVYLALGETAAAAGDGKATWNEQGYYFAENGSFIWGDVERAVTRNAHDNGWIPTTEMDELSDQQVTELDRNGLSMWGGNARGHAVRARKLLGWTPQQPGLFEILPSIVEIEAHALVNKTQ